MDTCPASRQSVLGHISRCPRGRARVGANQRGALKVAPRPHSPSWNCVFAGRLYHLAPCGVSFFYTGIKHCSGAGGGGRVTSRDYEVRLILGILIEKYTAHSAILETMGKKLPLSEL